jgi:hypothetical protein
VKCPIHHHSLEKSSSFLKKIMGSVTTEKKSVRFDESHTVVCELPNREDIPPEEHESMWFSKSDFAMSRTEAKLVSNEAVRFGISKSLDGTFHEKNSEAQERLQVWSAQGDAQRGLERWSNKCHGDTRQAYQFKAIMAVLEAQDEMLHKEGKIDPDKLRKISHKKTKTARHFARMMGKADSYAISQELDAKNDCCTVTTGTTSRSLVSAVADDESSVDPVTPFTVKDGPHFASRLRRFGIGARRRDKTEERVSRIA